MEGHMQQGSPHSPGPGLQSATLRQRRWSLHCPQ